MHVYDVSRPCARIFNTRKRMHFWSSNLTPSGSNFSLAIADYRFGERENARQKQRIKSLEPRHTQHRTNNARRDTFAISRSGSEWESRRGRSAGLPETSYKRKRLKRQRGRTGMSDTWG